MPIWRMEGKIFFRFAVRFVFHLRSRSVFGAGDGNMVAFVMECAFRDENVLLNAKEGKLCGCICEGNGSSSRYWASEEIETLRSRT